MSKVNFVRRQQEGLSLILSRLDTDVMTRMGRLAALSNLVQEFDAVDYAAAGLSSDLPESYADKYSAHQRALEFSRSLRTRRPAAAYVIHHARTPEPLGMMTFARTGQESFMRDNKIRRMVGWYSLTRLPYEERISNWNDLVVEGGITVAKRSGIQRVEVMVTPEDFKKAPGLTVVEHEVDLQAKGFILDGSRDDTTEDRELSGTIWHRNI